MSDQASTPEQRLAELGLTLPDPFPPAANYLATRRDGDLLYVSGHGPMRGGRAVYTGKVGRDLDLATARESAELTMLSILATLKAELGELSRVRGFLRLLVLVNATEEFQQHPQVADGASSLIAALYGDAGRHARSAIGVASLPLSIATEIEAVVRVG